MVYKPEPNERILVGYEGECPPQRRFSLIDEHAQTLMDQCLVVKGGKHAPVPGIKADQVRNQLRGITAAFAIFRCGHREGATFDEVVDDIKWEMLCDWYDRHGLEMELEDEE